MSIKMKEYPIVSIIWEDHTSFQSEQIPKKIKIRPTLTVGALIKKTKKYFVIAYNIERYDDRDDFDFIIILRSCILGQKEYGTIELHSLRFEGAN